MSEVKLGSSGLSASSANSFSGKTSEELFQRSKEVVPGGVHSPVRSFKGLGRGPVFFEKAEGPYLWSVEGKKYIDFCQSFGPLVLGHRDPEVEEEVLRMVKTAWTFGAAEPYSLELAEWICQEIPFVDKIRFVSSGTEAVMSALRVARAVTGRKIILKFDGCYHGHVDSLLVKAGSGLAGESSSSSDGVPADVAHHTLVLPLDDEEQLEELFSRRGSEIAAVIIEPLPANYGLLQQRKEFLLKLRSLSKKHGTLLIFDEVISGFRVGLQGMAGLLGITPDLVTYGKVIGGGFPVGAYAGKKEYMDTVAPLGAVYQAGTLSANPIGMRAGLVSLKKMKRVSGYRVLEQRGEKFYADLSKSLNQYAEKKLSGKKFQLSHFGSLFWIHSGATTNIRSIEQLPKDQSEGFKSLFLDLLDKNIYLAPNAYEVGFLSLAHTPEVLDTVIQTIQGL